MGHQQSVIESALRGGDASEVGPAEKSFQVGLVYQQLGLRDGQLIHLVKRLKQSHLGDGVLFSSDHFPANVLGPQSVRSFCNPQLGEMPATASALC